ncbi:hypothetical protein [Gluconobacter cerinus]|nr:hypothetical protein [Gluconobacter cerinus]
MIKKTVQIVKTTPFSIEISSFIEVKCPSGGGKMIKNQEKNS